MSVATRAIPQFREALENVGLIVFAVATAMLEGISLSPLRWKSGSTMAGAAKSTSATPRRSVARPTGSAGPAALAEIRRAASRPGWLPCSCGDLWSRERVRQRRSRRPPEQEREAREALRQRRSDLGQRRMCGADPRAGGERCGESPVAP